LPLALIRVDDRLIHGQVIMGWTRSLGIDHIVAADDQTAANPMQRSLMQMAVPAGLTADICPLAEAPARVAAASGRVLQLVRGPEELVALRDAGLQFDHVNVGNVHAGPDRRRLTKEVYASEPELDAWRRLVDAGVRLEAQWLPDQSRTDLGPVIASARAER
jgi:mannose/fructose/N-acetylgalactosamine-specific phosphotransferase system component IIB